MHRALLVVLLCGATAAAGTSDAPCVGGAGTGTIAPGAQQAPACTSASYDLHADIAYADGGTSHQLDLYRPHTTDAVVPVVVWVHGGGWQAGDKADVQQALRLACRGFAVASINYRLSGEAIFPAQIHDVKAAIRHLRANAAPYGLDPTRFAVFGSSAGGHLAALAGTSGGVADLEDLGQGNPTVSSRVQAAVDWYGPTDVAQMDAMLLAQGCPAGSAHHGSATSAESRLLGCTVSDPACASQVARANPVTYVDAGDPPFLVLHGTADCTVPTAQSGLLHGAIGSAGACSAAFTVTGAGHGGPQWTTAPVQDAVAAFLSRVFNARRTTTAR